MTCTKRGTRPGSPMADIIFHCLMHDIQEELQDWLLQQEDFLNICHQAGVTPLQVIWSDDLAIPWATREAEHLPQALSDLLEAVRDIFQRRGFKLNLNKNKTSVVATFRGKGAPRLRREVLLTGQGGHKVIFQDKTEHWLHYLTAYKHLGTYYTADLDMDLELRYRLGMARSTFTTLAKPIFCNRRLPIQIRFRLFTCLVESKLYFGCGAWTTPTPRFMRKLGTAVAQMCRRIGGWTDFADGSTQAQIFSKAGIIPPRVVLARERLRYAMRICQHGSPELKGLLRLERTWMDGLEADLRWLGQVSFRPEDIPANLDQLQELHSALPSRWMALIKQGIKRHSLQEFSLQEAHSLHRHILHTLRDGGATWTPDPFEIQEQDKLWSCACGRSFTSAQGLSTHRRKAHEIFSLEHKFLSGATCPHCHTFLWSTQRLQQHLAYIPRGTGINPCYHALKERGFNTAYEPVKPPSHLRGINRADALSTAGPFLPPDTTGDDRKVSLQQELDSLTLHADFGDFDLENDTALQTFEQLSLATSSWFASFQAHQFQVELTTSLDDTWLNALEEVYMQDAELSAALFIHWGDHHLPALLATWMDGEAEPIVEDGFYSLVNDIPRFQRLERIQTLRKLLQEPTVANARHPHRPARYGGANEKERNETREEIACLYQGQQGWQGHVAATISGSPCETFSAARAQAPPAELLEAGIQWPRPLRSYARLFGLDGLSAKELRQMHVGTSFFLQTTVALTYQLVHGGYAVSEHPWIPRDPELPSIWRTAVIELLCKHPQVQLHRVEQWMWGSTVVKPTGLLAIRLPKLWASTRSRVLPNMERPQSVAIGVA